jgi:hypothetical protein
MTNGLGIDEPKIQVRDRDRPCFEKLGKTGDKKLGTKTGDRRDVYRFPFVEKLGNVPSVPGFPGFRRRKANIEILSVQTSNEHEVFETEWFQEGERNRREFMTAYQTVSKLMWNCIETLAVLPNA